MKRKLYLILVLATLVGQAQAQKPGWAPVPPMGWNSWNHFGTGIDEKLIMETADAMVSSGMKDAGYRYVVIDDGWQLGRELSPNNRDKVIAGRDAMGKILADPEKFPHGIKFVADYVHSKGLKFGLYTAPGKASCGGYTSSGGHEELDINTFAEWGVDYIKLDWCGCTENDTIVLQRWRNYLNKASRPIVLSVNTGNLGNWLPKYADMWRTSSDITAIWASDLYKFKIFPGVADIIEINSFSPVKQAPSSWNDADMLQACNNGLPLEESKSHMSVWAIFGAPLMAGNDLRGMSPEAISILANKEVIAVNQDPLAHQGIMMKGEKQGKQIWVKKLQYYSDYAVLLLNITDQASKMTFSAADINLKGNIFIRNLWNHSDLGIFDKPYEITVPAHGSVLLKVTANEYPAKLPETNIPVLPVGQKIEVENSFLSGVMFIVKPNGFG